MQCTISYERRGGAFDSSSEEGWRIFNIDKEFWLKMAAEKWGVRVVKRMAVSILFHNKISTSLAFYPVCSEIIA
jgi:hypothetical protein